MSKKHTDKKKGHEEDSKKVGKEINNEIIDEMIADEGGIISFDTEDLLDEQAKKAEDANEPEEVSEEIQLKQALSKAVSELEEKNNKYIRLMADFDNFKKRNNETFGKAYAEGVTEAVKAFLPVVDSIDRAMNTADENIKTGLAQVKKQLDKALADLGVTVIEAKGADFDPAFHNAVMSSEDPDNKGKVLDVFQNGYMYKGKVLRYAMVRVAN